MTRIKDSKIARSSDINHTMESHANRASIVTSADDVTHLRLYFIRFHCPVSFFQQK